MHPPTKDEFLPDNKLLQDEGRRTSPSFGESEVWGPSDRRRRGD
jgi:hypothetical protein